MRSVTTAQRIHAIRAARTRSNRVDTRPPSSTGMNAVITPAAAWRAVLSPSARAVRVTGTTVSTRAIIMRNENDAAYPPGSTPANQKSAAASGGYSRAKSR